MPQVVAVLSREIGVKKGALTLQTRNAHFGRLQRLAKRILKKLR
jgi:hypothetical protein